MPILRFLAALGVIVAFTACTDDDDTVEPDPLERGDDQETPDDTGAAGDAGDADTAGDEAWTALAEAPIPLTEVATAAFGGELWSAGGLTSDRGVTTAVQIFDPATESWRSGPDLPEPLHHAALVATDTHLVVIGGYRTLAFDPVADVFVLDESADGWTPGPDLPQPRGAGAAAWDGARIVYGGGVGDDGLADDVLALEDVTAGDWAELGSLSTARDHLAAASDGAGTVWFLGGREESLDRNLGTVDVVTGDDIAAGPDVPTPRGGVAAFFSDAQGACLAGGEAPDGTFDEVECTEATLPSLSTARHGLGAGVIDGVAYVVLGGPEPGLSVSGVIEALRLS